MHTPLRILIVLVIVVFSPHEKVSRKTLPYCSSRAMHPGHGPSSTLASTRTIIYSILGTALVHSCDQSTMGRTLGICMYANN